MSRRLLSSLLLLPLLAVPNPAPDKAVADWPAYGRDAGGSRYSPLDQINRSNVKQLRVAWTYHTGEAPGRSVVGEKAAFEATPILAGLRRAS